MLADVQAEEICDPDLYVGMFFDLSKNGTV